MYCLLWGKPCRYNIFDEAIAEVLQVMEYNFKADFERTSSYKRLNRAVQREAKEMQVLRQVLQGYYLHCFIFILS